MTTTTQHYGVAFDDGEHNTMMETFINESDAWDFYHQQIKDFKSGNDEFYKQFIPDNYGAVIEGHSEVDEGIYEHHYIGIKTRTTD